ncbi:MAG: hypothetical protein MPJ24_06685, partial [Pirellulaceae bacterium]|nr:hypothetical protein [Pirellulaceae bacterium]
MNSPKHSKTFFSRWSLLILAVVFFIVPFSLRGAKLALQGMKNDVKDWLPAEFPETKELAWFRDQFMHEQFVVASWPGCQEGDGSLEYLSEKINANIHAHDKFIGHRFFDSEGEFLGDQLGLYTLEDDHFNWGGLNEKWLQGRDKSWYFVVKEDLNPEHFSEGAVAKLYQWDSEQTLPGAIWRFSEKLVTGANFLSQARPLGEFPVEFYEDPEYLEARLFKDANSGPDVLEILAGENGTLNTSQTSNPRELALSRLKGALYGPDGKQTCLLITLTESGKLDLNRVVGRGILGRPRGLLRIFSKEAGIRDENFHLGGPSVDNVAVDEEGAITLFRLIGYSLAVGLGLSWLCFR